MKAIRHILFASVVSATLALASTAEAQCEVCTLVVGAGVGLSRWLGIDDTISGLWIGGLTVSLVYLGLGWMERHGARFRGDVLLVAAALYLWLLLPLYLFRILGQCANKLWGIDKLLIGIAAGSVLFYLGAGCYRRIKMRRGHAHFPFEKVVMPIAPLIVASAIFYFLVRWS